MMLITSNALGVLVETEVRMFEMALKIACVCARAAFKIVRKSDPSFKCRQALTTI